MNRFFRIDYQITFEILKTKAKTHFIICQKNASQDQISSYSNKTNTFQFENT